MKSISGSIEETRAIAEEVLVELVPVESKARVLALYGNLGAGKTTFTQCLAEVLGVGEQVTSPTFVIQKIYKLDGQKFSYLIHIDAYRLESGEELKTLGWEEIVADSTNLIVIEWPERIGEILPPDALKVEFSFIDESHREIKYGKI